MKFTQSMCISISLYIVNTLVANSFIKVQWFVFSHIYRKSLL